MKKLLITLFISISLLSTIDIHENKVYACADQYSSEIVIERDSGRILHEKNAYDKKYMASTTKILTAITIIENCDLNAIVTVGKETVGIEGSSIYLEVGEKISVKDLLYGLMLRSGNDCAETLAVYCSGSIEEFSCLMNKKAKSIGANYSNFVNPHGLHNDNHYTTAYDLALISAYAMKNNDFRDIVSKKSVNISFSTHDYVRHITNKNKLLFNLEGCTGIKTGYTKKAGRCLVSSINKDGMELICVVLNCPPMFERSTKLFNDLFNKYKLYKLVESDNIIGFALNNRGKNVALHVKNDIILPLNEDEFNNIEIKYDYPDIIDTTKKDEMVGKIKIYLKNKLIFTEKIYTI